MRPMQLKPAHPISRLALSPDGRRLAVVQHNHGLRVFDTADGREELFDPKPKSVGHYAPTGRHTLSLTSWELRLAEVAAGRAVPAFQAGWKLAAPVNIPPEEPATTAFGAFPAYPSVHLAQSVDYATGVPRPPYHRPFSMTVYALSADHRFAVGRIDYNEPPVVVDLAFERPAFRLRHPELKAGLAGAAFTAAGSLLALTAERVFVFELPPQPDPREYTPPSAQGRDGGSFGTPTSLQAPPPPRRGSLLRRAAAALRLEPIAHTLREEIWGPTRPAGPAGLAPVASAPLSAPQPDTLTPFAVLPCGTKFLARGVHSRVELRSAATGEVLTVWKWGLPQTAALAASADGMTAAAGGARGRVVVWDLD